MCSSRVNVCMKKAVHRCAENQETYRHVTRISGINQIRHIF